MPPSYTTNLAIHKPATGEEAGTWGTTANKNYDVLDTAIDGNVTIPLSSSGYTLQTNQDAVSTGHNKVIVFTGALTGDGTVTISPNTLEKIYYILNHTTGGFALNITQGSGPVFKLLNGYAAIVYADGLGNTASVKGVLADRQLNSLLVQTNLIVQGYLQCSTFNQPATFQGAVTMQAGATISAPLTLALGSDAPYDMYYRSSAGTVARLPIGAAGQTLQASSSGPVWTTVSIGVGSAIASSVPRLIFYANQASALAQDNNLAWLPGAGQNGHLGVNIYSPAYAIDVIGDVNVSGRFLVNGQPFGNTLPSASVQQSSDLGIGNSFVDLPGTLLFPPANGRYLVIATIHFQGGADNQLNIQVQLVVGGSAQPVVIGWGPGSSTGSDGVSTGHWIVAGLTTSTGIKLQGARVQGAGNAVITAKSTLSMVWIAAS
jgi:hypothetical protein